MYIREVRTGLVFNTAIVESDNSFNSRGFTQLLWQLLRICKPVETCSHVTALCLHVTLSFNTSQGEGGEIKSEVSPWVLSEPVICKHNLVVTEQSYLSLPASKSTPPVMTDFTVFLNLSVSIWISAVRLWPLCSSNTNFKVGFFCKWSIQGDEEEPTINVQVNNSS